MIRVWRSRFGFVLYCNHTDLYCGYRLSDLYVVVNAHVLLFVDMHRASRHFSHDYDLYVGTRRCAINVMDAVSAEVSRMCRR